MPFIQYNNKKNKSPHSFPSGKTKEPSRCLYALAEDADYATPFIQLAGGILALLALDGVPGDEMAFAAQAMNQLQGIPQEALNVLQALWGQLAPRFAGAYRSEVRKYVYEESR